jgi:hypothetical protein
MTGTKRDDAARMRGELTRDSVGRRLSPAIDARRRLTKRRPTEYHRDQRNRFGPSERCYDYFTRSHD